MKITLQRSNSSPEILFHTLKETRNVNRFQHDRNHTSTSFNLKEKGSIEEDNIYKYLDIHALRRIAANESYPVTHPDNQDLSPDETEAAKTAYDKILGSKIGTGTHEIKRIDGYPRIVPKQSKIPNPVLV